MADVIPLAPLRRPRPEAGALPAQGAQILFFTGVRYERAAEPLPREKGTRPARRSPASGLRGGRKARQPA
jgi:hypothetical protein